MPYKDREKQKEYHREYYKKYMKTVGIKYREKVEKKRTLKRKQWKNSGAIYYKLFRIQKMYGDWGVNAFIRDEFSCVQCGESDFRTLVMHHIIPKSEGGSKHEDNLLTLCENCHAIKHFDVGQSYSGNIPQKEWDIHWLNFAKYVSEGSKCLSRKIGAVIVLDNKLLSIGRNGPARGVKHCNERDISFYASIDEKYKAINLKINDYLLLKQCPRQLIKYKSGEGLHLCQAGHAERNALIQAGKNGVSTLDTSLYCWCPQVCKDCAIEIVNAGVKELIFLEGPAYDGYSETILNESKIRIRRVNGDEL